jgi:hypothetical protein
MHSAVNRADLLEPPPDTTDSSLSWSELKLFDENGLEITKKMADIVNMYKIKILDQGECNFLQKVLA